MRLRHAFAVLLLVPVLASAQDAAPAPKERGWLGQARQWIGSVWNRRDAASWLDQIGRALREQNYQGTLVMVSGGRIETVSIYHAFANGVERERLVTLSGQRRELVRNNQRVVLLGATPGTAVAFDANPGGRWNPAERFAKAARLEGYGARLGRTERVAGHDAQIVELSARDPWRYGYRLWLEKETGLPLRLSLLDAQGRTLEQIAFTDIQLGKAPAENDLRASGENPMQRVQTLDGSAMDDPGFNVVDPPPGFTLRSARKLGQATQLLYGDGLASVSVYVEPMPPGSAGHSSSRNGAVNAQAIWRSGQRVIAIGKVPAATVARFARNLQPVAAKAAANAGR